MARFTSKDLLGHIVSLSISFGASEALAAVERIPAPIVTAAIEESEERGADVEHRKNALLLLAEDPRATVRMRVAQSLWTISHNFPTQAELVLQQLVSDRAIQVRTAAAAGFAEILERASPARRVEMVCRWSLSECTASRVALARALCSPVRAPLADLVIEHLARDPEPEVREAAAQATLRRLPEHPTVYRAILEELTNDDTPSVRATAIGVAASLARLGWT